MMQKFLGTIPKVMKVYSEERKRDGITSTAISVNHTSILEKPVGRPIPGTADSGFFAANAMTKSRKNEREPFDSPKSLSAAG
jgi:hypothetical protein